jgi:phosphotransferase system HPr-like phosphotransfer protein
LLWRHAFVHISNPTDRQRGTSMTTTYATCGVCVPVDHGLQEVEAVMRTRYAREFPCELHTTWGAYRVDAKSIIEMIDLSHHLGDEVVLELEAEGDSSLEALDCLIEIVTHHRAPARDDLAYFSLVEVGGGQLGGSLGITSLSARDALSAFALHPRPWRGEAQDPIELGRFSL